MRYVLGLWMVSSMVVLYAQAGCALTCDKDYGPEFSCTCTRVCNGQTTTVSATGCDNATEAMNTAIYRCQQGCDPVPSCSCSCAPNGNECVTGQTETC